MSLESGVILWRLNHELLPDPGNPMARMTLPLDVRGAAVVEVLAAAGEPPPPHHLPEHTLQDRLKARPQQALHHLYPFPSTSAASSARLCCPACFLCLG